MARMDLGSTSGSIQDSWIQDFNSNHHDAYVFDPDVVLSKLKPRNQRKVTPRQHSRGPSSSPPLPWDAPSSKKNLKAYVNKTVDRTAKKIIRRLSSDLDKSRAETVLGRIDKEKAIEALGHEN
ncbi:Hypothetical protein D9617_95g039930 [Elsinoe fawcettii]|nr:Hypothetical protein D9617_95g039930 [Elsinoe fawcettii]